MHIDNNLPKGEDWHRELLLQMAKPYGGRKEVIISKELLEKLKEFLKFRHLFRHIYGFELKWNRIKPLCFEIEDTFKKLKQEINKLLDKLSKE